MRLKNFKGFQDTEIPEFRKVNLIVGGQNVGKTSLLEAVIFAAGDIEDTKSSRSRLPEIFRPNEGEDSVRFWQALVGTPSHSLAALVVVDVDDCHFLMGGYATETDLKKALEYTNTAGKRSFVVGSFELSIRKLGLVSWITGCHGFRPLLGLRDSHLLQIKNQRLIPQAFSIFSEGAAEQVKIYCQLVVKKKKQTVFRLLQKIEPRIESIDAVSPDGEYRVYIDLKGGQVLPMSQLGHGFTRLFELYAGLAVTDSKLALIDEIENGIHYSALPVVFQGIRELCESSGVQSIITTHSLECIQAAYGVFKDQPQDFQLIRLERTENNNVRAVAINDENLATVMASGWEIR